MKKMMISYSFFVGLLCLLFSFSSSAQERQFLLPDAEALFGKNQEQIFKELAGRNYSFIQQDGNIFEYKRTTPLGYFELSILFNKTRQMKAIVWQEHIVYANTVAIEVQDGGYVKDESIEMPGTDIVLNRGKRLKVLISPHPETNTISLNMQKMPNVSTPSIKPTGTNRPKAVFHGS